MLFHLYNLLEKVKLHIRRTIGDCLGLGLGRSFDYKAANQGHFLKVRLIGLYPDHDGDD